MEIIFDILQDRGFETSDIETLESSYTLLLMLPIVMTVTGIARHIFGLKALSVYAPIVLTFAFYEMGYIAADNRSSVLRGLQFGLALYLIVFVSTVLLHRIMKRFRVHYIPKSTLVLIGVTLSVIAAITIGTILFEKKGLIYLDIFSIVMITSLSDRFVSVLSRKDIRYASTVGAQTLLTSLFAYSIIASNTVEEFVVQYALLVIIGLIMINTYIGKYMGLRFSEYIRFKDILLAENLENVRNNKKSKKK